jgi:hypothetical protein
MKNCGFFCFLLIPEIYFIWKDMEEKSEKNPNVDNWPALVIVQDDEQIVRLSLPPLNYVSIGRAELLNEIVLFDVHVSRIHAVISKKRNNYYLKDMHTKSGTLVNGAKISDAFQLRDGDTIQVGKTKLVFHLPKTMAASYADFTPTYPTGLLYCTNPNCRTPLKNFFAYCPFCGMKQREQTAG